LSFLFAPLNGFWFTEGNQFESKAGLAVLIEIFVIFLCSTTQMPSQFLKLLSHHS
jgi:hypothetical protein